MKIPENIRKMTKVSIIIAKLDNLMKKIIKNWKKWQVKWKFVYKIKNFN